MRERSAHGDLVRAGRKAGVVRSTSSLQVAAEEVVLPGLRLIEIVWIQVGIRRCVISHGLWPGLARVQLAILMAANKAIVLRPLSLALPIVAGLARLGPGLHVHSAPR